jgi:hypothetical protein
MLLLVALGAASCALSAAADKPIASPAPLPALKKFTTMRPPATATGAGGGLARPEPVEVPAGATGSAGLDPFSLPTDYRRPDGSFDQDALVAQQKRRLGTVIEKLKSQFTLTETPHFLVFSDADPALSDQFAKWGENLYDHLCREFGFDPKLPVWDGKCVLAVFSTRQKFETYARQFDNQDVSRAGAYFCCESFSVVGGKHDGAQGPNLVHICIPTDDPRPQKLLELLAHEGTHAFFQMYCRSRALPLWLHEGLAEYMTVANDPALGPDKGRLAAKAAGRAGGVASIFALPVDRQMSLTEYSVAYSLVDYLQKTSRKKFRRLIDLLKDGRDVDAALQEAYEFSAADLEKRWRASVIAAPAK